jgi:hypothetical protein
VTAPAAPNLGALAEQQHLLDTVDASFAHLAPGYPDTSSPVDFAASVAAGYVAPVGWDASAPDRRAVTDTPTGGAL